MEVSGDGLARPRELDHFPRAQRVPTHQNEFRGVAFRQDARWSGKGRQVGAQALDGRTRPALSQSIFD